MINVIYAQHENLEVSQYIFKRLHLLQLYMVYISIYVCIHMFYMVYMLLYMVYTHIWL